MNLINRTQAKIIEMQKGISAALILAGTLLMIGTANATTIWTQLKNTGKNIYSNLLGMVIIIAGICFIVACIMMLFASNDKNAEGARRWAIRILIILAIVAISPLIFKWVTSLGSGDVTSVTFGNSGASSSGG